jgi:hypothetical protein
MAACRSFDDVVHAIRAMRTLGDIISDSRPDGPTGCEETGRGSPQEPWHGRGSETAK